MSYNSMSIQSNRAHNHDVTAKIATFYDNRKTKMKLLSRNIKSRFSIMHHCKNNRMVKTHVVSTVNYRIVHHKLEFFPQFAANWRGTCKLNAKFRAETNEVMIMRVKVVRKENERKCSWNVSMVARCPSIKLNLFSIQPNLATRFELLLFILMP